MICIVCGHLSILLIPILFAGQGLLFFDGDLRRSCDDTFLCPGYYTRSGYVPGPVCKYNWTKTWDVVKERNSNQNARIFSYLTKDEGELFPGKLACENRFVFIDHG